jgi:hypothetical protein
MRLNSADQFAGSGYNPSLPLSIPPFPHIQNTNFSFGNPTPGFPQFNNYHFENDNLMNNFNRPPNIPQNNPLPFPQGIPPGMGMPLPPPSLGLGIQPPVNLNAKKPRVVGRVPCQWFNTPNGCSWGDKCTFAVC